MILMDFLILYKMYIIFSIYYILYNIYYIMYILYFLAFPEKITLYSGDLVYLFIYSKLFLDFRQ